MNTGGYRVVLDTNQIVAAGSRWLENGPPVPDPNTSRRILIKVAQSHTGLYCGKIMGEYLEKLIDRGHPTERVLKLITYIMGAFTCVDVSSPQAPFPPTDADDEIFVLCALDGQADFLVSEDHALLELKPHYSKLVIGCCKDLAEPLGA